MLNTIFLWWKLCLRTRRWKWQCCFDVVWLCSYQSWNTQRWFDVVRRCKLQGWNTQSCFNVDSTLFDVATSINLKTTMKQRWNVCCPVLRLTTSLILHNVDETWLRYLTVRLGITNGFSIEDCQPIIHFSTMFITVTTPNIFYPRMSLEIMFRFLFKHKPHSILHNGGCRRTFYDRSLVKKELLCTTVNSTFSHKPEALYFRHYTSDRNYALSVNIKWCG